MGVALAFAWIVFSLLGGFGSSHAAADDGDDNGLLGAVTTVVDKTASRVTDTVSSVSSGVAETVNSVVAVAPAPVQQPVREAVQSVGELVSTTTRPVADAVSNSPVGTVTEPVVEAVEQLPVVGAVVADIGLGDATGDLAGTVDATVGELVHAVPEAGSDLGLSPIQPLPGVPVIPTLPPIPVESQPLPALDEATPAAPDPAVASAAAPGAASTLPSLLAAFEHRSAAHASTPTARTASSDPPGSPVPAGGLCPPSALSSGPGGAGSGAWALVALGPLVALRAWVRRAGPTDEHAPPVPPGLTDVSPD